MASSTVKKHYLEPDFSQGDFSILSQVTKKALTINALAPLNDKSLTKSHRVEYKKPQIYDAGGNMKKQWFVFYSFRNPDTGKFERFKIFKDINSQKTKAERKDLADYYRQVCLGWLEKGGTPHTPLGSVNANNEQNIITCIAKFIQFSETTKTRPNTKAKYRLQLTVFKNWLIEQGHEGLTISQVKKQYIFEYMQYVKKRPGVNTGKTINDYLTNLSTFFNHYIDNYDDFLDRNPAKRISREPVEKRGNIAFTDEEFAAIKKYLLEKDPYLWFVCQVIYYTGLRNEAEALEIRIGDFDFKRDVLWVEAWVAKNKIKQAVPVYPEFKELLLSININEFPKDWYLLGHYNKPSAKKVGIDVFPARFRKVKKYLGLGREYGLYCLKSTRACHLYDDEAAIRDIQRLFRHATPLITMEYLKSLGRVERGRVLDKGRKI